MSHKRAADADVDHDSPEPSPKPPRERVANSYRPSEDDCRKRRRVGHRAHKRRELDRHAPTYEGQDQSLGGRRSRSPQAQRRVPGRKAGESSVSNQAKPSHPHSDLSSRIHSLKRVLMHPHSQMPADVRQDKERELASLILEQREEQMKRKIRDTIGRYHFVRFLERQKAEKKLTKLLKNNKAGENDEAIKMTQTDLNYAIYAPLDQKYISLFPRNPSRKIASMAKDDQKRLTEADKEVLFAREDDAINVVGNLHGQKPPMWYEVEKAMKNGTLEALRDGKLGTSTTTATLPAVGSKVSAAQRIEKVQNVGAAPAWMKDNGEIAPEDLDSDSDAPDGGFFER